MTTLTRTIRSFAARHDDIPAFHAGYLLCTLLIAALLNIGMFAVLILLHCLLDIIKYRDHHGLSWRKTFEGMARENLVDVTLLCTALAFAMYFHHSAGFLAGAGGVLRAEMSIVRGFFLLIPKFTILHNVLCVLANIQHYYATINPRLGAALQPVERCYLLCLGVTIMLLAFAPWLLGISMADYTEILVHELRPGVV
jgi:hypothetical protein